MEFGGCTQLAPFSTSQLIDGKANFKDVHRIQTNWKLINLCLMVKPLPARNVICRLARSCGSILSLCGKSAWRAILVNAPSHYAMEVTFLNQNFDLVSFVLERVDVGLNFYCGQIPQNESYVQADYIVESDITISSHDFKQWVLKESGENYDFALSNCKHLAYNCFRLLRGAFNESFLDFCLRRDAVLSASRKNIQWQGIEVSEVLPVTSRCHKDRFNEADTSQEPALIHEGGPPAWLTSIELLLLVSSAISTAAVIGHVLFF